MDPYPLQRDANFPLTDPFNTDKNPTYIHIYTGAHDEKFCSFTPTVAHATIYDIRSAEAALTTRDFRERAGILLGCISPQSSKLQTERVSNPA